MNVGNRISEAITFYGRNPPMLCNELSFDCFNGSSGSRHCCRLRPNVNNKWRRLPLVKACRRLRVNECDVNSQIRCKSAKKHTFSNLCPLEHTKPEFISENCLRSVRTTGNSHFCWFQMNLWWNHQAERHEFQMSAHAELPQLWFRGRISRPSCS